ncbi:MAG: hypothetical protein ACLFV7_00180 [Phycisphaerae bacterium]
MKWQPVAIALALAACMVLVGCTQKCPCEGKPGAVSGADAARTHLDVTGGAEAWQDIDTIDARATMSIYGRGENGDMAPYVLNVRLSIRPWANRISAEGVMGNGTWSTTVDDRGEGSFRSSGTLRDASTPGQIKTALGLLLHRVRGAGNIVYGDESATDMVDHRIDGIALDCVKVRWTPSKARSYCFSRDTDLLRFVVAGGQEAGDDGTVTRYDDYTKQANGMVFPMSIRVVEIGEYVLLGSEPVLETTFQTVTMK